jgi:Ion channel
MSRRLLGQELRAYSLITWFFERLLWGMYLLSPSRLAGGSRVMHYRSEEFRLDPHGTTMRRSRRVEVYILAWFVIEAALLIMAGLNTGWPLLLPRIIASIRILDILQSSVNLSVFDQLRSRGTLMVSSAVRTLVLSFLNYLELIILFGVIYTSVNAQLIGSSGWLDALYFSVVTQLTIGYGDIRPVGVARLISSLQGLIAVAFTILIFGRIVSVLPRIESVMQHDAKDAAPPRA